jgi:radical SAM superfamily enzyme YgiQ (UPF0313 family)
MLYCMSHLNNRNRADLTKLRLIVPATQEARRKRRKALLPPLGLAMVAALTPPDVDVSLTDENVTGIDFQEQPDLVGITVLTVTAKRAYEIADTFRARGVKVVLGGVHPSVLPEEASQHADAVVVGEAEGVWPALIEDFKANRLRALYQQSERPSLAGLPVPRRDLFTRRGYLVKNTVSTTRGCPYSCAFCTVTSFFGHTYRCRPVPEVLKEIDTLNRPKFIAFVDDNIVGSPNYAKELFSALTPYRIKWVAQCSITIAKDDELLRLAAASGCVSLFIGFESVSPASLAAVGKKVNMVGEYENAIKKIHSHGIGIHGFFIFGFDEDSSDVFARTVRFAQKTGIETAQFDFLTPYPGTPFGKAMDEAGRISTKDWSRYGHGLLIESRSMPRKTLEEGHDWAWREFYSLASIWRRLRFGRRYSWAFWIANLSYRARWRGKLRSMKNGSSQRFARRMENFSALETVRTAVKNNARAEQ